MARRVRSRLSLVALSAAAALITGCGIDDPYQPNATTSTATTASPTTAPLSPDEGEVKPGLSPSERHGQRRAERAARAFVAGYLPYSYGLAPARRIRAATPALHRELAANPPRVSALAVHTARPRVRQLRVSGLNGSRAYVLVQVEDGSRTYPASLTLERRGSRWLVAAVG